MSAPAPVPTLEVRHLRTHFFTPAGVLPAVDDLSLTLERGRILGLVGESGSGKTVTGFSILGLLGGQDLVTVEKKALRSLQGHRIAMIFQDPMMTLNPVLRVQAQMIDAVLAHDKVSRDQ